MWGIKCCFPGGCDRDEKENNSVSLLAENHGMVWGGGDLKAHPVRVCQCLLFVQIFVSWSVQAPGEGWPSLPDPRIYSPAAQGERQKAVLREKEIVLEIMTCLAGFNKFSNGIRCPWLRIVTSS